MKRLVLAMLIVAVACLPAMAVSTDYSAIIMADGPLAYWQFDDTSCALDAVAADSSGYGYDMVYKMQGAATISFTSNTAGPEIGTQAMVLPGGDPSWVETAGASGLHLDTFGAIASYGSTVEFWINTTSSARTRVFSTFSSADRTAMNMMLNTGNSFTAASGLTEIEYRTSDSQEFLAYFDQSVVNIYDGGWHHVAWTFDAVNDSPEMSIYLDGTAVPVTVTKTTTNSTQGYYDNPVRLGAGGYAEPFSGFDWVQYGEVKLDEVAVYSRKLDTTEIAEHYNAVTVNQVLPPELPDPPAASTYSDSVLADAPIAYYRFEENNASGEFYAYDASGNSHHMAYKTEAPGTVSLDTSVAGSEMGSKSLNLGGTGAAWLETIDYNEDGSHLGTFGSEVLSGSTVEFWINTTDTENATRVFSAFNTDDATGMGIQLNKGESWADIAGSTEIFCRSDGSVSFFADFDQSEADIYDGQWHHVAVLTQASDDAEVADVKVYIDGTEVTVTVRSDITTTDTMTDFANPFRIGSGGREAIFTNNEYGNVLLDEMAIYDRLLNSSEIAEHIATANGGGNDIPGDANKDGKVDGSDVTILAGNWQKGVGDGLTAIWEEGDFNRDGKVDGSDVTILAGNWQYGVEAAAASVPEPSVVVLLLAGLAALAIRRK